MDRWLRVSVPAGEEVQEAAAAAFFLSGFEGLELRDGEVVGYAPAGPAGRARLRALEERLARLGLPCRREELEDTGWAEAWKAHWRPAAVGARLWVVPSWHADARLPEGAVALYLDPGMAFGTGEHASTRLALILLEQALRQRPGARVLDAGTGSGILAVAAARLGAARVLAVDVDPVAVRAATENAGRNGVADRVEAVEGDAGELAARLEPGGFDVIAANILAEVLIPMAPGFARLLAAGGEAVLSGVVAGRAADVEAACRAAGLACRCRLRVDEWCALRLVREREP